MPQFNNITWDLNKTHSIPCVINSAHTFYILFLYESSDEEGPVEESNGAVETENDPCDDHEE